MLGRHVSTSSVQHLPDAQALSPTGRAHTDREKREKLAGELPGLEGKWYSPSVATTTTFLTLDKKGRTTFPEEVRQALGVAAGDFILLERTERGTFELVPATLVPNDQLWFHHPEMQARIARAEEDFALGRATRTETPEQAQAFLDSLKTRR